MICCNKWEARQGKQLHSYEYIAERQTDEVMKKRRMIPLGEERSKEVTVLVLCDQKGWT